jgi:polyferredoxin
MGQILNNARQDSLLRDISAQVKLLEKIRTQLASQDSPRQFIWNTILQVIYVAIGFLFGVFSIFQWHAQWISNFKASQANHLALTALCLSNNSACLTYLGGLKIRGD